MRNIASLVLGLVLLSAAPAHAESFTQFLRAFEQKAVAAGVSASFYRDATTGLTPDSRVPKLVETQPEFTTPMWTYMDQRVTADRISRGQKSIAANKAVFARVGERFGVDPYLLGAIWGIETDYGAVLANGRLIRPIIPSLATLVYQHRASRLAGDEADFIAALKLAERGPLDARHLVGSWAGAIGHLQVNPSSVLENGTDGDGDGKVDLQDSLADALATSARFLLDLGYQPHLDWGYEVAVPTGFDYLLADRENLRPLSVFVAKGIRRINGKAFPDGRTPVFLYVPAGKDGPKFLMTGNYLVLKGYNFSDSYALTVAHLADRLKGGTSFVAPWPRKTALPNLLQRKAIQAALTKLGLYDGPADGRLGSVTQTAYAKFQARQGEVADGFITREAHDELVNSTH